MISELADGIWSCTQDDGPRIVREVVIAGDDEVLVVDTGLPGLAMDELLPLVERLGRRRLTVLITHPDSDHLGGTAELLEARPDARVLAGEADLALVGDPGRMITERYARFTVEDDVPFGAAAVARAEGRAGQPFGGVEAAPVDAPLELGGRSAEIVPTAGHSAGHVSVWVAREGVLAAGDAVMGRGIPTRGGGLLFAPQYTPPALYRATIERVRALAVGTLATGHDPILRGDEVEQLLTESRAASDRLAGLVAGALDATPCTLLAVCERVHAAYGGLPEGRAGDLAATVDGHIAELVAQGLADVVPDHPRRFRSRA